MNWPFLKARLLKWLILFENNDLFEILKYLIQHYHMIKEDGNWLGLCGEKAIPNINESGADIFRNAIKTMHAAYIGFHGSLREWLRDNPDLTGELLNLSGYWYFPESLEITGIKKSSLSFIIKWFNKGVAPAYSEYALKIKLSNKTNPFESMEFEIENPVIEI